MSASHASCNHIYDRCRHPLNASELDCMSFAAVPPVLTSHRTEVATVPRPWSSLVSVPDIVQLVVRAQMRRIQNPVVINGKCTAHTRASLLKCRQRHCDYLMLGERKQAVHSPSRKALKNGLAFLKQPLQCFRNEWTPLLIDRSAGNTCAQHKGFIGQSKNILMKFEA